MTTKEIHSRVSRTYARAKSSVMRESSRTERKRWINQAVARKRAGAGVGDVRVNAHESLYRL